MDLQISQYGEFTSVSQRSATIYADIPLLIRDSTQMGSQSNQKSLKVSFMGEYKTKEKMGSGKVGNCLSPKILWRHLFKGTSAQQRGYGNVHMVEMAFKPIYSLGNPLDS